MLYAPQVTPTQRKLLNAKRLRETKIATPAQKPSIAPVGPETSEPPPQPRPRSLKEKLQIIRKIVGDEFEVSVSDLMLRSRKHRVAHPRQLAMYFSLHILHLNYSEAGRRFGRDHATIMNAELKVRARMREPVYADTVEKLRRDILVAIRPKEAGQ